MNESTSSSFKYTVGGPLKKDAPSYIKREADRQLYEALKLGKFCYVLNSRQMGKSSLRVQVMNQLQGEGVKCGVVDISMLKTASNEDEWYQSFVKNLAKSLGIRKSMEVAQWWQERGGTPLDRFNEFIDEELLGSLQGNIVIFVDEIDSILSFQQKDDFFAMIRAFHSQRVDDSNYERLAFTLLGVANPSDLIQDSKRTPFNIGIAIDLKGFQKEEIEPLTLGLGEKVADKKAAIEAILTWTGGQPFLTQKVFNFVANQPDDVKAGSEAIWIEELVRSQIIDNWIDKDSPTHLKYIWQRLTDKNKADMSSRLLGLYQQILEEGEINKEIVSAEQMELRLTGLVVEREGKLKISNRIYQEVFDLDWVKRELAQLCPYREAIEAWLKSNKADKSRLLDGKALEEAREWYIGKPFSRDNVEFLTKSQDKTLEVEKEKNRVLGEAEQKARQLAQEAQQQAAEARLQSEKALLHAQEVEKEAKKAEEDKQEAQQQAAEAQRQAKEARLQYEKALLLAQEADKEAKKAEEDKQKAQQQAAEAQQQAKEAGLQYEKALLLAQEADKEAKKAEEDKQKASQEAEKAIQRFRKYSAMLLSAGLIIAAATGVRLSIVQTQKVEAQQQLAQVQQQKKQAQQQRTQARMQAEKAQMQAKEARMQAKEARIQALVARDQKVEAQQQLAQVQQQKKQAEQRLKQVNMLVEQAKQQAAQAQQLAAQANGTAKRAHITAEREHITASNAVLSEILTKRDAEQKPINKLILAIQATGKFLKEGKDVESFEDRIISGLKQASNGSREENLLQLEGAFLGLSVAGQSILSTDSKGILYSVDLQGKNKQKFPCSQESTENIETVATSQTRQENTENIEAAAISQDGLWMVIGDTNGKILVCDVSDKSPPQPIAVETNISALSITPDRQWFVSGDTKGMLQLWDRQGNKKGEPVQAHDKAIISLATFVEGTNIKIVFGGASEPNGVNSKIGLWQWDDSKQTLEEQATKTLFGNISSVAFSSKGDYIISGGGNGYFNIWDTDFKEIAVSSHAPNAGVAIYSVAISPDGQTLAVGNKNGIIQLWKWDKGNSELKELENKQLRGHNGRIYSLAFINQENLVSGGDTTVRLWDIKNNPSDNASLQYWLDNACQRLRNHPTFNDDQSEASKAAREACGRKN